eukprot:469781-Rhodomonas_salina.4
MARVDAAWKEHSRRQYRTSHSECLGSGPAYARPDIASASAGSGFEFFSSGKRIVQLGTQPTSVLDIAHRRANASEGTRVHGHEIHVSAKHGADDRVDRRIANTMRRVSTGHPKQRVEQIRQLTSLIRG